MRKQSNTLNFEGQNIYVGIDVHLKSWTVSILSGHLHHKTFVQPPSPEALSSYLHSHFPNGNYLSAYEAGFSGFWAHYKLVAMGIQNIVVNPADVSTSQKERLQKTDAVDSRKIARSLRSNELTAIHVPCRETLEVRTLLRSRDALVRDLARMKQRIKRECGPFPFAGFRRVTAQASSGSDTKTEGAFPFRRICHRLRTAAFRPGHRHDNGFGFPCRTGRHTALRQFGQACGLYWSYPHFPLHG